MRWLAPLIALFVGLLVGYLIFDADAPVALTGTGTTEASSGPDTPQSPKDASPSEPLTEAEASAAEAAGLTKEWFEALERKDQIDQLDALLARMRTASLDDFPELLGAIRKFGGNMRWMARNLLVTRWAEADPDGMLAYIEAQPSQEQWGLRSALYEAWARDNAEAAFASARNLTHRREQQNAMQTIIRTVADGDPRRAIELAGEMEDHGHRNDWVYQNIFSAWANDDPAAARQAALAMEDGREKVRALTGAIQQWMHDDPLAALDWLDSLPADGTVYRSRKEVFRNMLNRDFETAREYLASRTDPIQRREILSNLYLANYARNRDFDDITEVYDWLGEVATGQIYDRKVSEVVRAMARIDPERAKQFALQLPPGAARMNTIGNLASELSGRDPAAAFAFIESLPYEDERDRALGNMGWQLARYHLEEGTRLIASSDNAKLQQRLAGRLTDEWSKYDREGALAWAESLENPSARQNAIRPVFENWLEADPHAALAYMEATREEYSLDGSLSHAFGQWTREDPAAATEALALLPESVDDRRSDIYRQVANRYVRHDPMAASEWIATLDDGPERDESVDSLVSHIADSEPDSAFIWAATIDDAGKRKNGLNRAVRKWAETDPDAAFEAIKDARIEAEEKKPLFELLGRGDR